MVNIGRFIDLTGQRFGRLVAKYRCDYKTNNDIMWHCKCDCGNEKDIQSKSLRYHKTKSCGCLKSESTKEFNKSTKTKQNKYDLSGEYGIGWTSNTDEEFYFDLEDYDKIKNYCWYKDKHDYICASERDIKNKQVFLHKVILGLEECNWKKIQIDHIKHKMTLEKVTGKGFKAKILGKEYLVQFQVRNFIALKKRFNIEMYDLVNSGRKFGTINLQDNIPVQKFAFQAYRHLIKGIHGIFTLDILRNTLLVEGVFQLLHHPLTL